MDGTQNTMAGGGNGGGAVDAANGGQQAAPVNTNAGSLLGDAAANTAASNAGGASAAALDFSTLLDKEGNFTRTDWAGAGSKLGEKIKSMSALVKVHETLERLNSTGSKVALPSEHASDEEWAHFYSRLGRPENAEGYEIALPEDMEKAGVLTKESLGQFREVAHKAGLTPKQASAIADYYFKEAQEGLAGVAQSQEQEMAAVVADLEKDFGPKGSPKWKREIALAEHGARALGIDNETLQKTPSLANNPVFIRAMRKVAAMTGEPKAAGVGSEGGIGAGAGSRLQQILKDPRHPYHIAEHPAHKNAIAEVQELFRMEADGL